MAARKPEQAPKDRILATALARFAEHGVEATSIQDVADAAGMSKQALMHHFRTKELLREGVYELITARMRDMLPLAATELVSRSHDRYKALIEEALRRFDENRDVARFLSFELLERPDAVMSWVKLEAAPWVGLIRGVVEQSRDEVADFDVEAHMVVLTSTMLALSALVPRHDRRWRARVQAATLQVLVLGSHLR